MRKMPLSKLDLPMQLPVSLKTNSSTTWDLASNLDLSGGALVLGGNPVVLDQVLTDNLTTFKLGEDATVTRNQGFTLGSLDLDNSTLTLGSATTDLTIDMGYSSDNGTEFRFTSWYPGDTNSRPDCSGRYSQFK